MNREKICTKCKETKPFTKFWKKKDGKLGFDCHCSACRIKKKKEGK